LLLAGAGAATPGAAQLAEPQQPQDTGGVRRYQPGPLPPQSAFAVSQLRHERVLAARVEARFAVKRLFRERGLSYPAEQIFMRIFKRERQLELWVRPAGGTEFALLKTYPICALAGELGPKRRQGDEQVPEGFYYIDQFNPQSDYLLSLHLDYPNRSDATLGESLDLGGDIYIHGGCNSAGCLALTDEGIKEVYWLSVEARGVGQGRIPVHIFPARLTDTEMPLLGKAFRSQPKLLAFWQNLKPGYDYFERSHRVPRMNVAANGSYHLAGEEPASGGVGAPASMAVGGDVEPAGPRPLGTPVNVGSPPSAAAPVAGPSTGAGSTDAGPTAASPTAAGAASPDGQAPANGTAPVGLGPDLSGATTDSSAAPARKPLGTPVPAGPTPPPTTRPGG
jgi:murein L,D-transpeptidase YafK